MRRGSGGTGVKSGPAGGAGTAMMVVNRNGHDAPTRRGRVRFDAIDLAILNQLQADSKITNAMLAQRVGISPPSTLERVKKLEQNGIIKNYVAIVDPLKVDKSIAAIVHVTLREHGEQRLTAFKDAMREFDEVQAAWHTAGEEDFILRVLVTDMEQYERFVVHRLSAVPNIGRIRTSFCLSAVKDGTMVPLDAVGNGRSGAGMSDEEAK
ncbi:MAG TPA: Lrp/AsnC family transcriptional regulator [Phycisphaerales bacterium]|nr:Lrp/AsnC family transcriptional regulator [Phycisphaerales bacterium]